jgi:hypothetical protein
MVRLTCVKLLALPRHDSCAVPNRRITQNPTGLTSAEAVLARPAVYRFRGTST